MQLYNTATKEKSELVPQSNEAVSLYTCGPTVYDYPHIGNWFAFIRWDVLARTLRLNNEVNWVMNITDVGHLVSDDDSGEDKLEKGAKREGKTAWDVARYYEDYFLHALLRLNFSSITATPKATNHIPEQIDMINALETKGYTYVIEDGVYFDTSKLNDYGKLANLKVEDLKAGARVEMCAGKKNITDFALWKFSPKNEKRDMEWASPWGKGFPGWHIECSAMAKQYLGDTLDIHCGGIDHIPVHHTNEIAQSETANGKPFANIWVHTNFIKVDGKKMSKSLGNLVTLEDIEQKGYSLQAFRLLVLESNYRTEAQFSWATMQAASNRLTNWQAAADLRWQPVSAQSSEVDENAFSCAETAIKQAMNDDLNTPLALQLIDKALSQVSEQGVNESQVPSFTTFLESINIILGINLLKDDVSQKVKDLLSARQAARDNKDYQESDKLRDQLKDQGVTVKDTTTRQTWTHKS